ncbi:hypothetical protein [Candidatus Poriferisodalis sp.]|uniref:hypothetical protein n=1 Tax=Candidatus Poriferisodalis sp. TaxID=3101277 RepID=UPI003B5C6C2D
MFLPKSNRRDFVAALRSGTSLTIDWFYGVSTFEWHVADYVIYEMPLVDCDW